MIRPSINKILFLTALLLSSCWYYSFRPGTIPSHIKSIALSPVKNETAEFSIAEDLTSRLTNQLISENLLPIADEATANSVIFTTVKKIDDRAYTFDELETVKEYKLTISVDYSWFDNLNKTELMKGTISQWSTYNSDNYNSEFSADDQRVRDNALSDAEDKIAEDLILQLTSDW